MADGYYYPKTFGGQPKPVPVGIPLAASLHGGGPHVIGGWYPPSEGRMGPCGPASSVANPHVGPGPLLGKLSGGNRIARGGSRRLRLRGSPGLGVGFRPFPRPCRYPDHPPRGWGVTRRERSKRACDQTLKIATWLILPVVICLSQRLSHACLSISNLYGETANGSLNQLSFI